MLGYTCTGNNYSPPQEGQSWKFTFDEMAMFDLPAEVDFILNATHASSLGYAGHSEARLVFDWIGLELN